MGSAIHRTEVEVMTIVVYPDNSMLFRDDTTKEPEIPIYTYEQVKKMFNLEDKRCGDPDRARVQTSCGLTCIAFYNHLSSGKKEIRGRRTPEQLERARIAKIARSTLNNRKQAKYKQSLLDGIAKQYELSKELFQ